MPEAWAVVEHGRWRCLLGCTDPIDGGPEAAINHIRLMHPDAYGPGPDRWPDGRIVVQSDPDDWPRSEQ